MREPSSQLITMQEHVRKYFYYGTKLVQPGRDEHFIHISSDADFECVNFTGGFTTLDDAGADDGVNHLSVRITDTGYSKPLFNEEIPMYLFMSPGRQRTTAIAGDPGNSLFYPIDFEYTFIANANIKMILTNDSDTANRFDWLFMGFQHDVQK